MGIVSGWRGLVLWNERLVLFERGSSLSPLALAAFVLIYALCGVGLVVSAVGLWWRRNWARRGARIFLVAYLVFAQGYLWLFVRTGLMWERRWVSLASAVLGIGIVVGALTWPRSRQWLGLN
jgi:hypothetical protein